MDEKTQSFNENQLKRTGFLEAFTPELIEKMNQGLPIIQHQFKKDFDGDKVTAMLHLKKSSTSDNYFLNKFDIKLQKDGQASSVAQTFYLNKFVNKADEDNNDKKQRQDNRYTLKESYNLLAGRPVFKTLTNNEGEQYQAWVKMDFKNKLDNGNSEIKQYTKNYGFDLESTLSKYPIKELTNEQYKQSLVDSLQRGNLQKATFVDNNGKEEKLLVSPSITTSSLNVYYLDKQRIPLEKLVEKNFIGNEVVNQLKELATKASKETPKETVSQSSVSEKNLKQEPKQKEEPEKKARKRQKVT